MIRKIIRAIFLLPLLSFFLNILKGILKTIGKIIAITAAILSVLGIFMLVEKRKDRKKPVSID